MGKKENMSILLGTWLEFHMYLEVMLELESLSAVDALEAAKNGGLLVRNHVALQPVHVSEPLPAYLASLK